VAGVSDPFPGHANPKLGVAMKPSTHNYPTNLHRPTSNAQPGYKGAAAKSEAARKKKGLISKVTLVPPPWSKKDA